MTRRTSLSIGLATAAWLVAGIGRAASAVASPVGARELVEVTDIDSLSVAPDDQHLVFRSVRGNVASNSYDLRWHSIDLDDGADRDLGSGGEPIYADPGLLQAETPLWPDRSSIIVRARVDDAVGLWRVGVGGEGMIPLVAADADVEDYRLAADGDALLYSVGPTRDQIHRAERKEYDNGILIDSSVDLAQNLYHGGSINGRMSSQRFVGYWYVRGGILSRAPRQQRRLDLQTLADRPAGTPVPPPPFDPSKALPPTQARNLAGDVANATWGGKSGRVTVALATGATVSCADPHCASEHVAAILWRPGTHELLLSFIDRERRLSLYLWDIGTNRLRAVAQADGLLSGGRRYMEPCAISETAAFCVASGPGSPPRLERIGFDSGTRSVLFDPNARLRAIYQPDARYLRWSIGGGLDATGVIMRPATATRPGPLFVNYYLCEGFLRGGEGDEWPIPELLDAGFTVACINAVPSAGPQDAVKDYQTGLDAVQSLVDRLSSEGIVDRSKVAMGGLSFGSEVTMWTAMKTHLLAVASVSSVQTEPSDYWLSAMPGSDQPSIIRKVWGLGPPEQTPARWQLVSPALNVRQIHIPILFQLPEQEARRVPELYARLRAANDPAELYAFPDEDHIKLQPRHRIAVYQRNLDWFRYWLQDYRANDPGKVEQYARWDSLRKAWRDSSGTSATTATKAPSQPVR